MDLTVTTEILSVCILKYFYTSDILACYRLAFMAMTTILQQLYHSATVVQILTVGQQHRLGVKHGHLYTTKNALIRTQN